MAARENQGYLIAVIILVLLVLVLGLVAFLGVSKANEYSEEVAKLQSDIKVEKNIGNAEAIQSAILRAYIGDLDDSLAEVPTQIASLERLTKDNSLTETERAPINNVFNRVKEVRDNYNRNMRQFVARSEDDESEELTWSAVLRNLIAVTADRHNKLQVELNEKKADREKLETEKKSIEERLAQNEIALQNKEEELASVQKISTEKLAELTKQFRLAQSEIQSKNASHSDQLDTLRMENGSLLKRSGDIAEENSRLKSEIAVLKTENFDIHDGTIVRVARGSDLVFLDIGRDDGLRTNLKFSVYDRTVSNFEKNAEKGKIEVIRVTGPHTADARITEENPIDPITRSDYVVTPTWDPNHPVLIALAGVFDLDNDGFSDLQQFIVKIENNGGKVVAYHDEEGKQIGKIDSSIGYLVLGDPPKPGPEGATQGGVYSAIRDFEKQAKSRTVPIIDFRKMLNWMGEHRRASIDRGNPKIQKFRPRSSSGSGSGSSDKGSGSSDKGGGSGTSGGSGSSTR